MLGGGWVIDWTTASWLDIVVDNCAICRNHIMDLCAFCFHVYLIRQLPYFLPYLLLGIDCQANQVSATSEECNAAWGICNVRYTSWNFCILSERIRHSMPSISIASLVGWRQGMSVLWTTENGSYRGLSFLLLYHSRNHGWYVAQIWAVNQFIYATHSPVYF